MSDAHDPVDAIDGYEFWRDACSAMTKYICQMLRLAEHPITLENVRLVAHDLLVTRDEPLTARLREGTFFSTLIHKIDERQHSADESLKAEMQASADYFRYFINRNRYAQEMLIESVIGVINGLHIQ